MENIITQKWKIFATNTLETSKELESINKTVARQFADNQIDLTNSIFEANANYFDGLTNSKEFSGFVGKHTELLNKYNETFFTAARSIGDLLANARVAYEKCLEKSIQQTNQNRDFSSLSPNLKETNKSSSVGKSVK